MLNRKTWYKPYTRIVRQLRQKIHAAAYYLNPAFYYGNDFANRPEISKGFLDIVEARISTSQTKFVQEASLYFNKQDSFARQMTIDSSKTMKPGKYLSLSLYKINCVLLCYICC